ncbi:hypothetical protein KCU91_g2427, partial [Aureobasidium melanogenum]
MASSPSVAESAGMWNLDNVTAILGCTTDTIQLRSGDEDHTSEDTDEDDFQTEKSETTYKTFRASVQKELLCYFSPYYRAALKGGFSEAASKSVVLELDPMVCCMLVGWLYSGKLPKWIEWAQILSLYVFADRTDMLALRRAIMTRIVHIEVGDRIPRFEVAAIALNSLPSTSPLYRWLLNAYIHHWMADYETLDDTLPNWFLVDWVRGAAARKCEVTEDDCGRCPCCEYNACNYHEHENTEEWKSTCFAAKGCKAKRPDNAFLVVNSNIKDRDPR